MKQRNILLTVLLFCILFTVRAHEDYAALPNVSGAVTYVALEKVESVPFYSTLKSTPLYKEILKVQDALAKKKMPVKAETVSVFPDGFLLRSNATVATVRYVLKYKVLSEKLTWEEKTLKVTENQGAEKKVDEKENQKEEKNTVEKPYFQVKNGDGDLFTVTFPKERYILVRTLLPRNAVEDLSARPLLKEMPEDVILAFLWPDPGATPEYPLMGELKSVSVYVRYLKEDARPVHAEIMMPAKNAEAAGKIATACKDFFDDVYKKASKTGAIPKDMVNAFIVTSTGTTVKIHSSLTDENAKVFLALFSSALSEAISALEPPEFAKQKR